MENNTIESLAIEIGSSTDGATSSINSLITTLNNLYETTSKSITSLEKLKNAMNDTKSSGGGTSTNAPDAAPKPSVDISQQGGMNVAKINEAASAMDSASQSTTKFAKACATINSVLSAVKGKFSNLESGVNTVKDTLSNVKTKLTSVSDALSKTFAGKAINGVKKLGSTIGSHLLKGGLSKLQSGVKKVQDVLSKTFAGKMIARIKKFALTFLGVRSVFTATRKALDAYMSYDTQLYDQLQNNWTVLGSLLAPILEYLIALFTKVVSYIAAFVKALAGVDLVARANSKSMDKMGKSAQKTLGNLASFDELNTVDFGGDSGSGTSLPQLTVDDVDLSGLDLIKKKLEANDWYGIGMEIGRALNDGLRSIDLDALDEKISVWGTHIGDLMNGLVDGVDWTLLGTKLAQGINIIINTAFNLITTFDASNFGVALGELFTSGITTINWANLTTALTKYFQGLFDAVSNFFKTVDWAAIGDSINTIFDNLDLGNLGTKLGEAIINIFNGLGELLASVDWAALGTQIADFLLGIDWISVLTSLITLLGEALLGLLDFLWGFTSQLLSGIWDKIWDWFSNTEIGKELIDMAERVWGAIKAIWDLVSPYFEGVFNAIKTIVEPIWNQIVNIFSTAWNLIKIVWDTVKGYFSAIWNTIKGIFSVVEAVFKGDFQGAWDAIKGIIDVWKGYFEKIWDNIKKVFSTVGKFFKDTFNNAWDGVKKVFSAVGDFFGGIKDTIVGILNNIIGFFEGLVNKIISGINKLIGGFNKITWEVPDWVPVIGGKKVGFNIKEISEISIPRLATGTNYVEAEGIYHLHKGEAVVPKKYNPALDKRDEGSEMVAQRLDSLINILTDMDVTNNVYVGNDKLYSGTMNYIRKQNNVYGTNTIRV